MLQGRRALMNIESELAAAPGTSGTRALEGAAAARLACGAFGKASGPAKDDPDIGLADVGPLWAASARTRESASQTPTSNESTKIADDAIIQWPLSRSSISTSMSDQMNLSMGNKTGGLFHDAHQ